MLQDQRLHIAHDLDDVAVTAEHDGTDLYLTLETQGRAFVLIGDRFEFWRLLLRIEREAAAAGFRGHDA